jgi:hypothetical protein
MKYRAFSNIRNIGGALCLLTAATNVFLLNAVKHYFGREEWLRYTREYWNPGIDHLWWLWLPPLLFSYGAILWIIKRLPTHVEERKEEEGGTPPHYPMAQTTTPPP